MECFANLVLKINTAPSTVSRTLHRFLYETVITRPGGDEDSCFRKLGHPLPTFMVQIQECVRQIKPGQRQETKQESA